MKINELFDTELNFEITGIVDDSRDVKDGYLFVATKGFNVDHYDYICDAIARGAVFIICDRELPFSFPSNSYIQVVIFSKISKSI